MACVLLPVLVGTADGYTPLAPSLLQLRITSKQGRHLAIYNAYDDFRSDAIAPASFLSEDTVLELLEVFVDSDYGKTMFGRHEKCRAVGITGEIELCDIEGPDVILQLDGKFWHRRETVLGRAAMWLAACMPGEVCLGWVGN